MVNIPRKNTKASAATEREEPEQNEEQEEVTLDPTDPILHQQKQIEEANRDEVAEAAEHNREVIEQNKPAAQRKAEAKAATAAAQRVPPVLQKARLKGVKYPVRCPKTNVYVPMEGTLKKVEISSWLRTQINAGLVKILTEDDE